MFEPLLLEVDILNLTWDQYRSMAAKITYIDRSNVEDELSTIATVYSYYHGLTIRAKTLQDEMVEEVEECEAALRKYNRGMGPKLTAIAAQDLVICDEDIQARRKLVIARKEIYLLLKSLCDSIAYKKDMLTQLSANQRQETKLYST
tara:strand:- start:1337 stop:1777 length:441 start_codon:yes stop_codon:yes gene_type:complete